MLNIPPTKLVNRSVKLNESSAAEKFSNPNTPATQDIKSLTKSKGFVTSDVKNPVMAPSRAPKMPPSAYPSMAPLIGLAH